MNRRARQVALAVAPAVAAAIGGIGSRRAPQVYPTLHKPRWAPPAGVFGPVWTVLYLLIGVAGWRLAAHPVGRKVIALHLVQLALNAAWPHAFFARGRKPVALAVIGALDAVLAVEVAAVVRRDPATAALLAPYLAWCGFATALNAAVEEPPTA
ncbi:TspO/MBR family protein [Jatrophihabitans sp. YIM 134969]